MLSTEIISMIELIRALAQRKSELDKEYFENFILPIWNTFIKVHDNYKETFKEYVEMAENKNVSVDVLINRIREDSIYTSDIRSELDSLIKHTPVPPKKISKEKLLEFLRSLDQYFFSQRIFITDDQKTFEQIRQSEIGRNVHRYDIIISLARKKQFLTSGFPRFTPDTSVFTRIIDGLQIKYKHVANAYFELRKEILT